MDSLYEGISLTLLGRKKLAVLTDSYENTEKLVLEILRRECQFREEQVGIIDVFKLLQEGGLNDLIRLMTVLDSNTGEISLRKVIIWKNLEALSKEQQKRGIYHLLNEIDQYSTNSSKMFPQKQILLGDYLVIKPDIFTIIPILELASVHVQMSQYVKEHFWFAVRMYGMSQPLKLSQDSSLLPDYENSILWLRDKILPQVYIASDIRRYIYSLIIHARNHRLCSFAPIRSRLTTLSIENVTLLAACLRVFEKRSTDRLFVTPEYCEMAMRKIGYWLIDWEQESSVASGNDGNSKTEYWNRLEVASLTGDWYNSDYRYVKEYVKQCKTDPNPTNYVNRIVEDAIAAVRPPL